VPRELANGRLPISMQGVTAAGQFLAKVSHIASLRANGEFRGMLPATDDKVSRAACLFAGTDKLSTASSGFIPIE
jgi:hypothetical protein